MRRQTCRAEKQATDQTGQRYLAPCQTQVPNSIPGPTISKKYVPSSPGIFPKKRGPCSPERTIRPPRSEPARAALFGCIEKRCRLSFSPPEKAFQACWRGLTVTHFVSLLLLSRFSGWLLFPCSLIPFQIWPRFHCGFLRDLHILLGRVFDLIVVDDVVGGPILVTSDCCCWWYGWFDFVVYFFFALSCAFSFLASYIVLVKFGVWIVWAGHAMFWSAWCCMPADSHIGWTQLKKTLCFGYNNERIVCDSLRFPILVVVARTINNCTFLPQRYVCFLWAVIWFKMFLPYEVGFAFENLRYQSVGNLADVVLCYCAPTYWSFCRFIYILPFSWPRQELKHSQKRFIYFEIDKKHADWPAILSKWRVWWWMAIRASYGAQAIALRLLSNTWKCCYSRSSNPFFHVSWSFGFLCIWCG